MTAVNDLYTHSTRAPDVVTRATPEAPRMPQGGRDVPDQRYSSRRWLKVRLVVLRRDLYRCRIVDGCTERATLVDHIMPTSLSMPDSLFYSLGNLRAGCRDHNLGRGFTEKPTVLASTDADVVTGDYS